jgi:hypothetical protein
MSNDLQIETELIVSYMIYTYTSFMCRHNRLRPLRLDRILRPPQTRHSLPLRIEIQPGFPIKVIRAPARHTLFIPRETEHGQRHRDGNVDTQLPDVDVLLEFRGGAAGAGEDGGAVAVGIGVDEMDGGGDGGDVEADEDGAEDLFCVAFHVWLDVGYDCGADLGEGKVWLVVTGERGWWNCLPSCRWGIFQV